MRAFLFLCALSCSGCHACVAILLEDEPAATSTSDPVPATTPTPTQTADDSAATPTAVTTPAKPKQAATPPPRAAGNAGNLVGRYECMQMRVTLNGTTWAPGALPGFSIDPSGSYTSGGKSGTVNATARDVTFSGGNYDGWRGAVFSDPSNFYIRFGKTPSDPRVGDSTGSGDFQCFRQK